MPSSGEAGVDPDHASGFGDAAEHYATFRPRYPDAVFERLRAALTGPALRVVELGAGSGQATIGLARVFQHVDAVEPDARMLDRMPHLDNVAPINQSAEEAAFAPASIDAVVCATAFHWMDQPRVVALAARWLRPGGVFFPFLCGPFRVEGAGAEVFRRHAALWGAYKDARLGARVDYAAPIIADGRFEIVEQFGMEMRWPATASEVAGLALTLSYAAAYARANGGIASYRDRLEQDFAGVASLAAACHLGCVLARRRSD